MKGNRIFITEAKARLGELVKRAAYGNEHFILEFRGKPQAAIIGYCELERLCSLEQEEHLTSLRELERLRARIAARTQERFDAVADVRQVRDERSKQL